MEPIHGRYDVVWMSHILHGEGPAVCQDMIQKAVDCLRAGGRLLIHDFILDDTRDRPLFAALFSLNMLLGTPEGRSYTQPEIIDMMKRAGLSDIVRSPFRGPTDSGVIRGDKR